MLHLFGALCLTAGLFRGMEVLELITVLLYWSLLSPISTGRAQQSKALSLSDVETLLQEGVSAERMAGLIGERGINFDVTEEIRRRLREAGADAAIMLAVERAGLEFTRKKFEEDVRKAEEDRRGIEEERRKIEAAKRKLEEEQKRLEEARKSEEEHQRGEAARQRAEEERQRQDEARRNAEIERRNVETQTQKQQETLKMAEGEAKHKSEAPKVVRGKNGAEMVLVPAGEFWMGSDDSDAEADEKPRRRVYVGAFYVDKYEVTNRYTGASWKAPDTECLFTGITAILKARINRSSEWIGMTPVLTAYGQESGYRRKRSGRRRYVTNTKSQSFITQCVTLLEYADTLKSSQIPTMSIAPIPLGTGIGMYRWFSVFGCKVSKTSFIRSSVKTKGPVCSIRG